MAKTYSIAIDGPAGAGKSTMAKTLAKELGFYERGLDTVTVEVISVGDGKWRRYP